MTDSFEVGVETYDGIDFDTIATEELDKAAVRTVNAWVDNMLEAGYRNTGDTANSITWESPEQYVRVVGSDRIAALIGEFGRRPGAGHPPPDALGDWVHEQAGLPDRGGTVEWDFGDGPETVTFDQAVYLIGKGIDESGLPAHAFGRRAFREVADEFERNITRRLQEAVDEQSI
ncbi:hypothetical protein [Natronoglomus mannanivorans]|uniref:Uncharacterized protein n=1 Tax=Natronoglomus mannanivorans TaxID=2979990 RepID=A0AAP2Z1M4_9EURY|nr:hypothetical protein [Halobacteria archaeon AArc-xg1-1]